MLTTRRFPRVHAYPRLASAALLALALSPLAAGAQQARATVTILDYDGQACRQEAARGGARRSGTSLCIRGIARHPAGIAEVTVAGVRAALHADSSGGSRFTGLVPEGSDISAVPVVIRAANGDVSEELYRLTPGSYDPANPDRQALMITNLRPRLLGTGAPGDAPPPAPMTAARPVSPPAAPASVVASAAAAPGDSAGAAVAAAPAALEDPANQYIRITEPRDWAGVGMARGITTPARRSVRVVGYASHPSGVASVQVDGREAALVRDANGQHRFLSFVPADSAGTREVLVQVNGASGVPVIGRYTLSATPAARTFASKGEAWSPTSGFRGRRWAVVVGISDYQDSTIAGLRFADDDAKAFYDFLRSPRAGGGGFPESQVKLLLNEQATFTELRSALFSFLRQATPDDEVIIYFAGHGAPDPLRPSDLYLLTHDTRTSALSGTAFPMRDLQRAVDELYAKHVVLFTDACHSGGITTQLATRGGSNRINDAFMAQLSASTGGLAIFNASAADQVSAEDARWGGGHGVFTHYLLDGLNGSADDDGDGIVTLVELMYHTIDRVRRETSNAQTPTIGNRTYDGFLPLAIVLDSAEAAPPAPPAQAAAAAAAPAKPGARAIPPALADSLARARDAAGMFPNSAQYRANLGRLLAQAELFDEAIATLREAVRLDPTASATQVELAVALRKADLLEQSAEAFEAAIARTPDVARYHRQYGETLVKAGRGAEAVEKFRRAARMEPSNAEYHAALGRALRGISRTRDAVAALQAAVQLDVASAEYRRDLGLALWEDGKNQQAFAELREAARLAPADAAYRRDLARVLQAAGGTAEARSALQEAVRLDTANAEYRHALGMLMHGAGQEYEAILELRAALRLAPREAGYHAALGEMFSKAGQADSAVVHLQEAVKLDSTMAYFHNALGRALRGASRPADALRELGLAVQLNATAQFHYDLGMLLVETGSLPEAVAALQQAARLEPGNSEYTTALRSAQRKARN